jgi:hypothetical protein
MVKFGVYIFEYLETLSTIVEVRHAHFMLFVIPHLQLEILRKKSNQKAQSKQIDKYDLIFFVTCILEFSFKIFFFWHFFCSRRVDWLLNRVGGPLKSNCEGLESA